MDYSWEPFGLDHHVQEPFLYQENQIMGLQSQMTLPQSNNPMLEQVPFTNGGMLQSLNANSVTPQNNLNDSHSFSNIGDMAALPPRRRKRKAPTLRSEDWEPVKRRIIELHITQNLPLPKVKQIIETEFKSSGFSATLVVSLLSSAIFADFPRLRQYRTRISK